MFLHSMYCLICLFTHFMNDFDRKMFDNDRWFFTLMKYHEICKFGGGGGGGGSLN